MAKGPALRNHPRSTEKEGEQVMIVRPVTFSDRYSRGFFQE
jgi:hypothetical protein